MIQDNILDLADTNEEIQGYYQNADYDITWHKSLYDAENVAAFDLNANYRGNQYAYRLWTMSQNLDEFNREQATKGWFRNSSGGQSFQFEALACWARVTRETQNHPLWTASNFLDTRNGRQFTMRVVMIYPLVLT